MGEPSTWQLLDSSGRDSVVYAGADMQSSRKVVHIYPYVSHRELGLYKRSTWWRAVKAASLGRVAVDGSDFRVFNKVVTMGLIGQICIAGTRMSYAVSSYIPGYSTSEMASCAHAGNSHLVEQRAHVWDGYFADSANIAHMGAYIQLLNAKLHLPDGQLTQSNTKPSGSGLGSTLWITDLYARMSSRWRVYRDPLDLSKFGV